MSYAYIVYNMKTIQVECKIITPVCSRLLSSNEFHLSYKELLNLSETLTDEGYHSYISLFGIKVISELRDIDFSMTNYDKYFAITDNINNNNDFYVLLTMCFVSEVLVSSYLDLMSTHKNHIQYLCTFITNIHRKDELRHSKDFSSIFKTIYTNSSDEIKAKILDSIPIAIDNFSSIDSMIWKKIFETENIPNSNIIINYIKDKKVSIDMIQLKYS